MPAYVKKTDWKNQGGVTLVIAIVMLASITFISFVLSVVIIREIGAARLILATEPAISGANSGGEVSLYQYLRQTGSIGSSGTLPQSGSNYQVASNLYASPYIFSLSARTPLQVSLYDAANPNSQAANYSSVTVGADSSSNTFKVEISSFANLGNDICGTPATVNNGQNFQANLISCGTNNTDGRYLITLTPTGNNTGSGQINTTDLSGNPKGVPSNTPGFNVTGGNGSVQRKIQINLQ